MSTPNPEHDNEILKKFAHGVMFTPAIELKKFEELFGSGAKFDKSSKAHVDEYNLIIDGEKITNFIVPKVHHKGPLPSHIGSSVSHINAPAQPMSEKVFKIWVDVIKTLDKKGALEHAVPIGEGEREMTPEKEKPRPKL